MLTSLKHFNLYRYEQISNDGLIHLSSLVNLNLIDCEYITDESKTFIIFNFIKI